MLALGLVIDVGCKGSALPAVENVVSVVLADIEAGKSDSAIASDVCAALGGTSATDAICASTEVVVQDVIMYLIDAGVLSASAMPRAKDYLARHPKVSK